MAKRFLTLQGRGTLSLPADVRRRYGLDEPGVQLQLIEREGVIELRPTFAIDADQKWFWSERWQTREREVDAEIDSGAVQRFDGVDALLAHLDADA